MAGAAVGKYCSCFTANRECHKNVMMCQRCQNITSQVQVTTPNSSRFPSSSSLTNRAPMHVCDVGRAVRNQSFLTCFSLIRRGCGAACPRGRAVVAGSPFAARGGHEPLLSLSKGPARESPPSQPSDLVWRGVTPELGGSGCSSGCFLDQPPSSSFLPSHQYSGCVVVQSRKLDFILESVVSWFCFCFSSAFENVLWVCIS